MLAKQSTAATLIVGPALDADGLEYTGLVIGDLSISKLDAGTLTALAASATLTHRANGYYGLVLTTGNTDTLGRCQIVCTKSGYQMPPANLQIVPANVYDSIILGSDYLKVDVTHWADAATLVTNMTLVYNTDFAAVYDTTNKAILSVLDPEATHGGENAKLRLGSNSATPALHVTNTHAGNNSHAVYFDADQGAGLLADGGGTQTLFGSPATGGFYGASVSFSDLAQGANLAVVAADAAAIKLKTDNLPDDPADQSIIVAATDTILTAVNQRATPAQVNAEVLDALVTDTHAELAAVPAATSSLKDKLTWLFMWARNKSTQSSTERKLYADDGTTVVGTEAVSDSGTFTKGEAS